MNPEDLEAELERLWARVTDAGRPGALPSANFPSASFPSAGYPAASLPESRDAAVEAINLIKRQHREQIAHWEEMLELKEAAIRDLADRLRLAEMQVVDLRKKAQQVDSRVISEVTDAALKLEAAERAIKAQEERFLREEKVFRELTEKTRQQLALETHRWRELERQWGEREQKYLDDIHEMQLRLTQAESESGKHQDAGRRLTGDLAEAKKAIEATLAELMNERRLRETADDDRAKAMNRVSELSEQLKRLQTIWEEERKQWQELWDRERSTWETQRTEFQSWEEKLRKEREEWHSKLKEKEAQELKFADQMAKSLRESSEATIKINEVLTLVQGVRSAVSKYQVPARARRIGMAAGAAAALLVVFFAGVRPLYNRFTRMELKMSAASPLPAENPTAIAYDGSALWCAEWSGRLTSLDPADPTTVLARHNVVNFKPFRPSSLAIGGEALWSLDTSKSRIVKHKLGEPTIVQASWPTPGPAPVALAHDGRTLWSFDAVNRALYKHLGEGLQAQLESYAAPGDYVPSSMQWMGEELWIHDSRGKQLLRMTVGEKSLSLIEAVPVEPLAVGMAGKPAGEEAGSAGRVWALVAPDGDNQRFTIRRYDID